MGSVQCSFGGESAQHRNIDTTKYGPFPRPHHHPNLWAAVFKLNAALSRRLQPTQHTKHTREDAVMQPIQKDRLKNRTKKITEQHLNPRSSHLHVRTASSQGELWPQLVNQLVNCDHSCD